jgi:hypothetical protein
VTDTDTAVPGTRPGWRERAAARLRALAERDMSRRDRARWASAGSLRGVGVVTKDWLYSRVEQTPSHCGPPEEETLPYIHILADANLSGFVTDNSQAGASRDWGTCAAWVCGFLDEEGLSRMQAAIAGTPLVIGTRCRGPEHHGHKGRWLHCPRTDLDDFYAERCPGAEDEIRAAWHVTITDPEHNRNDRLWPALERFSELEDRP